jgi:hypothetical protein
MRIPTLHRSILFLAALVVARATPAQPHVRRALLVGINDYRSLVPLSVARDARYVPPRGAWVNNLHGALRDVAAVERMIRTRFAFDSSRITVLRDSAARRDRIFAEVARLARESSRGDVVLFYFAGHGSQRRNSQSAPTQLDQTIVPADANLGVRDIRDKELRAAFAPLIEKGVVVTLIFDSCHSGSITRGPVAAGLTARFAPIDTADANDAVSAPAPGDRDALVVSAAQDADVAYEAEDPAGTYGVFTDALVRALEQSAPNEPASAVFQRLRGLLRATRTAQEPAIDATGMRVRRGFFGDSLPPASRTLATVTRRRADDSLEVQGGPASGMHPGTELQGTGPLSSLRLRVTRALSPTTSLASLVGSANGAWSTATFEVRRWGAAPDRPLFVYVPPPASSAAISEWRRLALALGTTARIITGGADVNDRGIGQAGSVLRLRGGRWTLDEDSTLASFPAFPTGGQILAALGAPSDGRIQLRVELPPDSALSRELIRRAPTTLGLATTTDESKADYALIGEARESGVAYHWIRRLARLGARSDEPLVRATPIVRAGPLAIDSLFSHAATIARVHFWLTLSAPSTDSVFPYRLALRRRSGGGDSLTAGPYVEDDSLGLVLVADSAALAAPNRQRRHVYVFTIDSLGAAWLLYPKGEPSLAPFGDGPDGSWTAESRWPREQPIGSRIRLVIGPPFGLDAYVLVTSISPIPVPQSVFEWKGLGSDEAVRGASCDGLVGLQRFVCSSNSGLRSEARAASGWSAEVFFVRSVPRSAQPKPPPH